MHSSDIDSLEHDNLPNPASLVIFDGFFTPFDLAGNYAAYPFPP